jgi:glutathione S-transferase
VTDIRLYQFPGSCSRVTMNALEEIGLEYSEQVVNLLADEHKSATYLALNAKGKVPSLLISGKLMTESAAILAYLDRIHPQADLLPKSQDLAEANQGLIDLVWCSSTIHPIVRQIRNPMRWTSGEPSGVKAHGIEAFTRECKRMSERVGHDGWWYGHAWSIVDVYLYWAYSTSAKGGFPLLDYPLLVAHAVRVRSRPSFQRALMREVASARSHRLDLLATEL